MSQDPESIPHENKCPKWRLYVLPSFVPWQQIVCNFYFLCQLFSCNTYLCIRQKPHEHEKSQNLIITLQTHLLPQNSKTMKERASQIYKQL